MNKKILNQIVPVFAMIMIAMFLLSAAPASAQQINTSTLAISAVTTQWCAAASQNFTVNITGGSGTMLYSLFTDQPWFSVSPESGQTVGEMDQIKVTFYPETLDPGVYSGNITIMGTFCINQPVVIPVTLTVDPSPNTLRGIRIPAGATGVTGYRVSFPLHLVCTGEVNAVAFSLGFNKNIFSSFDLLPGIDAADCTIVTNGTKLAAGQIGIQIAKPTGMTFADGLSEVAVVSFLVNSAAGPGMYPFTFTNAPIIRAMSDVEAYPLSSTWPNGIVQVTAGYEADVSPRPNGTNDGTVALTDWVQIGRFAANLDTSTTTGEFQRADCAPRDIRGDGILTVADWVQAGRYYIGFDAVQLSGGPLSKATNTSFFGTSITSASKGATSEIPTESVGIAGSRQLTIQDATFNRGTTGSVSVILQAFGNENALGFSAHFDPTVLRYVGAQLGPNAAGATLMVNTKIATNGEIGVALALPANERFPIGNWDIVRLRFEAISGFNTVTTSINLNDSPLKREISSYDVKLLTANYFNATGIVLVAQVDTTAPAISVTTPSPTTFMRTMDSSISLGGTASDNWNVTGLTWATDKGGAGACIGTALWATPAIALGAGTNLITIQAVDPANNTGQKTITVVSIPMTTTQASTDSDGDGLSNWQEILAGTDPYNANSCLKLAASGPTSASDPQAGFRLSWSSTPGLSYSIWRTTSPSIPFTRIASGLIASAGNSTYIDTAAAGAPSFFYYIKMDTP